MAKLWIPEELTFDTKLTLTPTSLAVLQPPDSLAKEEEKARSSLLTFFSDLSTQNYADITDPQQVAENEFIFYVVFRYQDGTRFEIGACCGGDPAAYPPIWQFAYPV